MTGRDLVERTDDELRKQLSDLKAELFNLRFQHATGQLENPIRLRDVRKDIARVLTAQRLREVPATEHVPAKSGR